MTKQEIKEYFASIRADIDKLPDDPPEEIIPEMTLSEYFQQIRDDIENDRIQNPYCEECKSDKISQAEDSLSLENTDNTNASTNMEPSISHDDSDDISSGLSDLKPFFDKAIEKGFMKENGKNYEWLKTPTSLAYFIGRIYCGDTVEKGNYGYDTWIAGKKQFPRQDVIKLFGEHMKNVAQLRVNKTSERAVTRTPPKEATVIDSMIAEVEKYS